MNKYIDSEKLIAEINAKIEKCEKDEEDGYPDTTSPEAILKSVRTLIISQEIAERLHEYLQQGRSHKSFCEENCKGYRDTGGKCFFDFNCSAKKAQKQPEVDLEKELCEYFEGWRINYYSDTKELLKKQRLQSRY